MAIHAEDAFLNVINHPNGVFPPLNGARAIRPAQPDNVPYPPQGNFQYPSAPLDPDHFQYNPNANLGGNMQGINQGQQQQFPAHFPQPLFHPIVPENQEPTPPSKFCIFLKTEIRDPILLIPDPDRYYLGLESQLLEDFTLIVCGFIFYGYQKEYTQIVFDERSILLIKNGLASYRIIGAISKLATMAFHQEFYSTDLGSLAVDLNLSVFAFSKTDNTPFVWGILLFFLLICLYGGFLCMKPGQEERRQTLKYYACADGVILIAFILNSATWSKDAWTPTPLEQKLAILRFPVALICAYNIYYEAVRIWATREKLPAAMDALTARHRVHATFFITNAVFYLLVGVYIFVQNHNILLFILLIWLASYIVQHGIFRTNLDCFKGYNFRIPTPRQLLYHKLGKTPKQFPCEEEIGCKLDFNL